MAATHGGKRAGAGRKPKSAPGGPAFTAEAYLAAVVEGKEPANALRIAAARTLIRYQAAMRRGPVPTPAVAALAKREALDADSAKRKAFDAKADAIRKKHGRA